VLLHGTAGIVNAWLKGDIFEYSVSLPQKIIGAADTKG